MEELGEKDIEKALEEVGRTGLKETWSREELNGRQWRVKILEG